jgi:hypothetical protein
VKKGGSMFTELEIYRKEVFDKWWEKEKLESKVNKMDEFHKDLFKHHKKGFVEQYIKHNATDDIYLVKNRPIEEQKKEFDNLFENSYKRFILSLIKVLSASTSNF